MLQLCWNCHVQLGEAEPLLFKLNWRTRIYLNHWQDRTLPIPEMTKVGVETSQGLNV